MSVMHSFVFNSIGVRPSFVLNMRMQKGEYNFQKDILFEM